MPQFSLSDFDAHISNLRNTLQFLNEALEATDHTAPDWLATDLVSLRNKSGRLQDEMQRFREQLEREGLGVGGGGVETKASNKRLSIESAKHVSKSPRTSLNHTSANASSPAPQPSSTTAAAASSLNPLSSPPPSSSQQQYQPPPVDDYMPAHIDVSEEVHRRLHESRLRRLMGSPATSQKRKYDVFEDTRMEGEQEGEDVEEEGRSPFKRVRASGSFGGRVGMGASIDAVLKRKSGDRRGSGTGGGREEAKKRRVVR